MRGREERRRSRSKAKARRMKIAKYPGYHPSVGWEKRRRNAKTGEWEELGYLVYPRDSKPQKALKRRSSKIARKKANIANGNAYKKHFDFWWKLD